MVLWFKLPITYIINMSITSGEVPGELRSARVKPLLKKKCRSEVGSYRPVSILCVVSKILERAVYNQLEVFVIKNNLIYEFQSGFRGNFSTDTCLIHLTDHLKKNTSKGLYWHDYAWFTESFWHGWSQNFMSEIKCYEIWQYLSKVSKGWSFIYEIANHIYN